MKSYSLAVDEVFSGILKIVPASVRAVISIFMLSTGPLKLKVPASICRAVVKVIVLKCGIQRHQVVGLEGYINIRVSSGYSNLPCH
jgi:hypothetical protein